MSALTPAFLAKTRETNCTVWIGATNTKGYGVISVDGKVQLAHRIAFESEYGPVPDGMVIDHLCRVRNCVNPMHLEAVTNRENIRRGRAARSLQVGSTCTNGHPLTDGDALYLRSNGVSECRQCRSAGKRRPDGRRPTTQRRTDRVAADLEQADGGAA